MPGPSSEQGGVAGLQGVRANGPPGKQTGLVEGRGAERCSARDGEVPGGPGGALT